MEIERIERLAIDMAGGQLNDDVASLFNEYLDEHPDTGKKASEIMELYTLCGNAIIQRSSSIAKPANRLIHKHPALWRTIRENVMFRAAVLMIAVLAGLLTGWLLKPVPKADIAKYAIAQGKPERLSDIRTYNISGEFWQKKVAAMSGSDAGQRSRHNFVTQEKSNLQRYMEYLKEKKHEF